MNGKKLLAGKNRDRHQFWIDGGISVCKDNGFVVSSEIIIRNEKIVQSACGDYSDWNGEQ